jgi:hypothetical protein
MLTAFECAKDNGPSAKYQTKARIRNFTHRNALQKRQMSHGRKDSKSTQKGEHGIGEYNDGRVDKGWFSLGTTGPVGGHGTHGNTQRKEALRDCCGPCIGSIAENTDIPLANVFVNSGAGAVQRNSLEEKDEKKEEWQACIRKKEVE